MNSLRTGIRALDRQLNGGLAEGSLVALVAPPDSPSSRILHQLMQQRPTTYITTLRPPADIKTELMTAGINDVDTDIEGIGEASDENDMLHKLADSNIYAAQTNDRDHILDDVNDVLDTIDDRQNVIIDAANPLESSDDRVAYQRFLRKTADKLRETNSVGLLHCFSRGEPPALREQTLALADTIWNLDMGTNNEGDLSLELSVPKNRGGTLILEKLTLLFDRNTVHTDISRNI